MRTVLRALLIPAWGILWLALTSWCSLAIWYAPRGPVALHVALIALLVGGLLFVLFLRRRALRIAIPLLVWGVVIAWFWWLPAPGEGNWQPDVKVAPRIEVNGDRVIVRSVRNFHYRSETDFDERWEDREYDLSKLATLDLFMSYWGPTLICHTFVSFGFEGPNGTMDYIAVSIETRKEVGQEYSALGGAFRQYPLVHVWAAESDVVKVRTNFRHEDVYRYRMVSTPEGRRRLFLAYVDRGNELANHPHWYNAVTHSCGVGIVRLVSQEKLPLIPPIHVALNGLWDRWAYNHGMFETSKPFARLRQEAYIDDLARGASDADFSERIRRRDVEVDRPDL